MIAKEVKVIIMMMLLVSGWNVHTPNCLKFIRIEKRRIIEAVACVRKYLVAASVERGFGLLTMSGMRASKFISSPTHIRNKLELSMVIIGPIMMVK